MPELPLPPDPTIASPLPPASSVSTPSAGLPIASAAAWFQDVRARWSTSPGFAAGGGLLALVVVAFVAWSAFVGRAAGEGPPIEATLPRADAGAPGSSVPASVVGAGPQGFDGGSSGEVVVVHVAGAVLRPGVYRLSGGARIADALDAAGGPTAEADVDALNLAALAADGERVYVPRRGEVPPPAAASGAGGGGVEGVAGPVDLNRATVEQLEALPGVGPSIAQAIVDHRERHGPFRSVDELLEVRGIGAAKLEALRSRVTVR